MFVVPFLKLGQHLHRYCRRVPQVKRIGNVSTRFSKVHKRKASTASRANELSLQYGPNAFQVVIDISNYKEEEVHVEVSGNDITITGMHKEGADGSGFVKRFVKMYTLNSKYDMSQMTYKFSGSTLTVTVPVVPKDGKDGGE